MPVTVRITVWTDFVMVVYYCEFQ